jgi:ribose transport system substrate-binding protein
MRTVQTATIVSAAAVAFALLGCGGGGDAEADKPAVVDGAKVVGKKIDSKERVVIAFISRGNDEFWRLIKAGAENTAAGLTNTAVDFKMMSWEPNAQKRMMDWQIKGQKVDAVILAPGVPDIMTEWINEAAARTIVITVDTDAPKSKRLLHVGTDHYKAGQAAGEAFLEVSPDGGRVCIFVGKSEAPDASARIRGFKSAGENKIQIIGEPYNDDGDRAICLRNVESARTAHGASLTGFLGVWAYNGPVIVEAVKAGGKRAEGLKIIAFEEEEGTLAGIEDGKIYATVVQDPYEMGARAVKTAAALARGDRSVLPANFPTNRFIEIPHRVIKRNDVNAFQKEYKEKLAK